MPGLLKTTAAFVPPPQGILAASAQRADVQTAVNTAVDGDTVLIPNGSATWTTGIVINKGIHIRAQNYTATPGGTATRNVTITNQSPSSSLFTLTKHPNHHVSVSGIAFLDGTATPSNFIRLEGDLGKSILISDCFFQGRHDRFGDEPGSNMVGWLAQGGVMWNCRWEGVGAGGTQGVGHDGSSLVLKRQGTTNLWTTASSMGSLDVNGDINSYIEDCTIYNIGQWPNVDDHGRGVIRHCTIDGSGGATHGFTSTWGGRHVEYYDNTFQVTHPERNHFGRYFWIRAGTVVFTDNAVHNAVNPGAYGNVNLFTIGDNTTPSPTYPQFRQPGWGHNGVSNVSDPIYSWNNTGARQASWNYQNGWESLVVVGRDVFVNAGAKPGYVKYAYPHPARATLVV